MTENPCLIHLPTPQSTQKLGQRLGKLLPKNSVIFLEGELGAGKTTLIQGLGQALGITDSIVSPTFTLINEYHEGRLPLYHLDLYRLDPQQAQALSLEIYWEGREVSPGITAIEWAQRLPYQPPHYLSIQLNHRTDSSRQATIELIGQFPLNLAELMT